MNAIETPRRRRDSTHLINRLHFEIRCPEQEQAFTLRHHFAQTLQPEIAEIIDQVCSEYVSEQEWLRIDKLELDLGHFAPNVFTRDFAATFRDRFAKQLAKQLGQISVGQRHAAKQNTGLQLFCHFMLLGSLPWWAREADVDIHAITLTLCTDMPARLRDFFGLHRLNRTVWTRSALQLDDAAKSAVIGLFSELRDAETDLLHWVETCKTNAIRFDEPERISGSIRRILLIHAADIIDHAREEGAVNKAVLDEVITAANPDRPESMLQLAKAAFGEQRTFGHPTSLASLPAKMAIEQSLADSEQPYGGSEDFSLYAEPETGPEQRYVVHHAGLILLAPFFSRFFDACGLLDGLEWRTKDSQYQAVHALKYLTTGLQKTAEYSLLLEKLICGIGIEEPIPLDIALQEQQIDQAHELLISVIEHWQALKNSSIDGLREAFLKRDGLITQKNNGWLLQVERKTLDVLLESIPWGYATITLPWNGYLIHVEW